MSKSPSQSDVQDLFVIGGGSGGWRRSPRRAHTVVSASAGPVEIRRGIVCPDPAGRKRGSVQVIELAGDELLEQVRLRGGQSKLA